MFPNMPLEHFNVSHILCPEFCFYNIYKNPKQGDYNIFILGLSEA
jgi:hypothetical protein